MHLLRGHLAFPNGRRGLSDEAQGDDAERRPGTDHPRAAAGLAESWVFAAVEGDGDGIVWGCC